MDDNKSNFQIEKSNFGSKLETKINFDKFEFPKTESDTIEGKIRQFKRGSSEIINEFKKREAYLGPSKKRQIKDLTAQKRKSKHKFKVFQKSY